MQRIYNMVLFKGAVLVKINIPILLKRFALKSYISKLTKFNRDAYNNNSDIKS